jgi:hypothetical protein
MSFAESALTDSTVSGDDWNERELDLIVQTYFAILEGIPTAPRGFKAKAKRALDDEIGRGIGSIDFKLGNLSFVAGSVGIPPLPGFAPARKAQKGPIYEAFDRYLSAHSEVLADGAFLSLNRSVGTDTAGAPSTDSQPSQGNDPIGLLPTDPVPALSDAREARPEGLVRLVRKFDPAARDERNRLLGRLGEQHVLDHEIARLVRGERMDLAKKVEWTSDIHGDGAGYDIRSFDLDGSDRLIEVKATKGGPTTDFFLTRTEREVSLERREVWRLYRLHTVATEPRLFVLKPPLEASVRLSPEAWRASF